MILNGINGGETMSKKDGWDDEVVKRIIIDSQKFFCNVDENFYDGIQELFTRAIQELKERGLMKKFRLFMNNPVVGYMEGNDGKIGDKVPARRYSEPTRSIQDNIKVIEDFFYSLGEKYGNMAHNELLRANIEVGDSALEDDDYKYSFLKRKRTITIDDANNTRLVFQGDYADVFISSHELAHRFTLNTKDYEREVDLIEQWLRIDTSFVNNSGFGETTAMLMELLCSDYLSSVYGYTDYAKWTSTVRNGELRTSCDSENEFGIESTSKWLHFIKNADTSKESIEWVKNILKSNEDVESSEILKNVTHIITPGILNHNIHSIGYFYAVYLKMHCGNDREQISRIIDKCLQINAYGQKFESEQMKLIQELGLPFVKDGKFVMDEECIEALLESYIEFFEGYRDIICPNQSYKIDMNGLVKNALSCPVSQDEVEKANILKYAKFSHDIDEKEK